jgi:hypothetical protein
VSLNNRISIRDTYNARGAVEIGPSLSSSGGSDTTGDSLFAESEKQQKQTMKLPGVKVVSERVISMSRNFRFTTFSHAHCRHCMIDYADLF